ncbi:uncharacterized protein podxl2 [Polymixia lowei]
MSFSVPDRKVCDSAGLALLAGCDAFRVGPAQRILPFSPPVAHLVQEEGRAQAYLVQELELVRPEPHLVQELVRAQPHLVHDVGRPEIHETSRSQSNMESSNSSLSDPPQSSINQDLVSPHSVDDSLDVLEDMERMVHLRPPGGVEDRQGLADATDPHTVLHGGPGAADSSLEASGFYGMDADDRDRGEEGEERERRGGGGGEERGEDEEVNRTAPDLDALIGYSPSFLHTSGPRQPGLSSPAPVHHPGLEEHRAGLVPEVAPLERELWEAEGEEEGQASGYRTFHSSITTTTTSSTPEGAGGPGGDTAGTITPETETGTDFGLVMNLGQDSANGTESEEEEREEEEDIRLTHLDVFTQNPTVPEVGVAPSREPLQPSVKEVEETEGFGFKEREDEKWRKMEIEGTRHLVPLNTDPSPTVRFTDLSWDWLGQTTPLQTERSEVRGGGVFNTTQQVMCIEWGVLTGHSYVILNMTENMNCEEFRADRGVRLLEILERMFSRRMNSPEGSWSINLSKPTHQQHQLLMNVASEHGVIDTEDVLGMLGEIRRSLNEVGIYNYSAASTCQPRPSQTRSDYGKLFVVLVIIGSVCMVIITSGLIYICWQKRLPPTKTMSRAEELHFVENGCHDNPTLDVTNDNQPEMQEKKPSTNGLAGGGEGGGEDRSRWQVFVNHPGSEEEEEEQDTHL